jgi:hypothetical protein
MFFQDQKMSLGERPTPASANIRSCNTLIRSRVPNMPWKCPACAEAIQLGEGAVVPSVGLIYRCSVCRLELIFDPLLRKMQPIAQASPDQSRSNVA